MRQINHPTARSGLQLSGIKIIKDLNLSQYQPCEAGQIDVNFHDFRDQVIEA